MIDLDRLREALQRLASGDPAIGDESVRQDALWSLVGAPTGWWHCVKAGDVTRFLAARQQCVNLAHNGCGWVALVPITGEGR